MSKIQHTDALAKINQKIVQTGQELPTIALKDGTVVQTGTVATMLHNIERYNNGERGEVENELKMVIPTLFKIGLFDLFSVEDWILGTNDGRKYVGECAKHYIIHQ